ncbi:hypothetical protein TD95_004211 [Thielaviopsis punctulata]|uniref:MHD domain-containing protein n=1 Tax=Thielaviopsis punctulata TaxID=72032 RepID=A0A0F4ZLD7_9PEZI|nr:hypothetical protein TD95_004211 [Thielaviopsis punctulata]
MNGTIESVHILDERNNVILSHVYCGRPPTAAALLPSYLAHPAPRPNLLYLQSQNPPTLLFSLRHDNLLLFATASEEIEPLVVLEFLHRLIDALEEFLGTPLLSVKMEQNYDVIAQLLNEMCDAGVVNTTEPNALRDLVEVEGWVDKLLGSITLPSNQSFPTFAKPAVAPTLTPALPWRRSNVRHTTNEMYCDVVESLSVTVAPSGRPLAAFSHGTIAFTSKVSGVPDILLSMSSASGKHHIGNIMALPVFHPCVRLQRWKERPGELSFVPPDGRFILASYEVDLLPFSAGSSTTPNTNMLKLPVTIDVKTGLGRTGAEFEVRLQANRTFLPSGSMSRTPVSVGRGSSASPAPTVLENLSVRIPFSEDVKNIPDVRPSRGDAVFSQAERVLEWKILGKELSGSGSFALRCSVQGHDVGDEEEEGEFGMVDFDAPYQRGLEARAEKTQGGADGERDLHKVAQNKILMPGSAMVSFSVKGWLASGLRVESIILDTKRSKGLGETKPYKGVKYLTVSRDGMEVRC